MVVVNPLLPCLGGAVMALSTSMNLYIFGRITGISGIVANAFVIPNDERSWRFYFISGLILGGWLTKISGSDWLGPYNTSIPLTIVAGFLVGFGAMMSNGCTSGHGLCGLPRFSIRSFVAIGFFMAVGSIFSIGRSKVLPSSQKHADIPDIPYFGETSIVLSIIMIFIGYMKTTKIQPTTEEKQGEASQNQRRAPWFYDAYCVAFGFIFAIGLCLSGMTQPKRVLGFLNFIDEWDASLAFVMGIAVTLNLIAFHYTLKQEKPVCAKKFSVPNDKVIDAKLVIGASIFGSGWGIAGLCPGPAIVGIASGSLGPILSILSMMIGMYVEAFFEKKKLIP